MLVSLLGRMFSSNRPPRQSDGGVRFCPRAMELEGRDVPAVIFDGTFPLEGSGGKAEVTVQVSYDATVDPYYHWDYYVTNQSVGPNALQPYIDSDATTMFWVVTGLDWNAQSPAVTNQSQPSTWNGHTWDYLGDTGVFWYTYPNYLPFGAPAKFSFTTAPTTITISDATFGDDAFGEAVGKVAGPGAAGAAPLFNVNTAADTTDAKVGDGLALDANGRTSLRAAIEEGNASKAAAVTVRFNGPAGMVGGGVVTLATALPALDRHFTILGTGASANIVERDAKAAPFRIFEVNAENICNFLSIGIRNGRISTQGAGILNYGTLTIDACEVYNNNATNVAKTTGIGGGIYSDGTLIIRNTSIHDNFAAIDGGGIYINSGDNKAVRLDVFANNAGKYGGGVYLAAKATLELEDSYVFENLSDIGAGLAVHGKLIYEGGEVANNKADSQGGGIWIEIPDEDKAATLVGVNVSFNEAGTDGGGVHLANSKSLLFIDLCELLSNKAANDGGGLLTETDSLVIVKRTEINGNQAGKSGGGFYLSGPTTQFELISLANNTALANDGSTGGFVNDITTFNNVILPGTCKFFNDNGQLYISNQ